MTFRPLLAATIKDESDLQRLRWPLFGSPKIDGIRCICHPTLGAVTRSLKKIPNLYIRNLLSRPEYAGFDGEIVVGRMRGAGVFARSVSGVMTQQGEPDFNFWVFDDVYNTSLPYDQRVRNIRERIFGAPHQDLLAHTHYLSQRIVENHRDALEFEQSSLEVGYEGIMLRSPQGKYKLGRSTFNEQDLLKLKRFTDAEAEVVGFVKLSRNNNPAVYNTLGYQVRSSHLRNKIAAGMLGALICKCPDFTETFNIGTGFGSGERLQIWENQNYYLGKRLTFKFQAVGVVDRPRLPIFRAWRPEE
jgi:DNA ligase 1